MVTDIRIFLLTWAKKTSLTLLFAAIAAATLIYDESSQNFVLTGDVAAYSVEFVYVGTAISFYFIGEAVSLMLDVI
jgi:hypothetical protein